MKYFSHNGGEFDRKSDYAKKILFTLQDFGNDGHLLQEVIIPPNTKQRKHRHEKQTEVFYIISGSCEIYIDEEKFDACAGDAFICEPGDEHWLWNKSDKEFKLVVFKINKPEDDDTVWGE